MDQLLELGFTQVELNYQVRAEWLPEIEKYLQSGIVRISSVHNVFPKTMDERFNTDSVMLGYEDPTLRKMSVELGKKSIDWACRLGAHAVVFHPTEVPLSPDVYDRPLKQMIANHMENEETFQKLQKDLLQARQADPWVSRMLSSIEELAEYVTVHQLPVKLGMENRSMCHQIPIYSEYEIIVDHFSGGPVGIWLDTGHGIMMQEIGLQSLPLSQKVADNIVGMHIHDAAKGIDHYAPCSLPGNVLQPFREYIKKSPIRVLELSGRLDSAAIQTGTNLFIDMFGNA